MVNGLEVGRLGIGGCLCVHLMVVRIGVIVLAWHI